VPENLHSATLNCSQTTHPGTGTGTCTGTGTGGGDGDTP
jgi:hypothetical protein